MTAILRQRLPCVGLFFCAAIGIILGRYLLLPGWIFALAATIGLFAAYFRLLYFAFPIAVVFTFAAAQAWQHHESNALHLAGQLSLQPQTCNATIAVLNAPQVSLSGNCRFVAQLQTLSIGNRNLPANCPVIVLWRGEPPFYGGEYKVRASISNCPPQRNPGAFDYSSWLLNAGIHSQLEIFHTQDAELLRMRGNPFVHFAITSRKWIERTLSLGIENTAEALLIKAMTIGDISDTPNSLKDTFRETGTFHIFSVSGLHVGIVAGLLWGALAICGMGQRTSVLIIIPSLFFYALITGLSPASLRAAIMLSVIALGLLLDRTPIPLNNIGAAGFLLLMFDSSQLFNSGFQLSFGVIAMICLIAVPLQRRFTKYVQPDPFIPKQLISPIWQWIYRAANGALLLVAVSLAAWLASLPLMIYYFHLVSFLSIPANLLAIPLSSVMLALAAVSLIAGVVFPWLADVFNQTNFLLSKILIFIVNAFAHLPGSFLYVGVPPLLGTSLQMTILDAGGGGATSISVEGKAWLIDSGSESFANSTTIPFLHAQGINRLDAFVLTHGDILHIGGFKRILSELHPRIILDSGLKDRSPTRRAILESVSTQIANTNDKFHFNESTCLSVLFPPPHTFSATADDKALVLRIETSTFSALLMSDAGISTEQWLLTHAADRLPCDLIVMGHHISGISGNPDFLKAAHPSAIIITAAIFPDSETIRPEWAQSLVTQGIHLLRQDETGAVTVNVNRDSFTLTPFLPTQRAVRIFSNGSDSFH